MSELLSELEFNRLLFQSAPRLLKRGSAGEIEGSRRRSPFELAVFQNLAADARFTSKEWGDWRLLILRAFVLLGESGFKPRSEVPIHNDVEQSFGDGMPPISRMLCQLEARGHIKRLADGATFVITTEGGRECLTHDLERWS